MSKSLIIISIILFIVVVFFKIGYVQATEETVESDATAISEETLEEPSTDDSDVDVDAEAAAEQVSSTLDALSTSSVTKVSTVNSYDQANLQLNNILSIILISIGVLLILFAIAILIRLKK